MIFPTVAQAESKPLGRRSENRAPRDIVGPRDIDKRVVVDVPTANRIRWYRLRALAIPRNARNAAEIHGFYAAVPEFRIHLPPAGSLVRT